MEDSMTLKT